MEKVKTEEYDVVSLDYDIHDGLDGSTAINEIICDRMDGKLKNLKKIIIHSANVRGREIMHNQYIKFFEYMKGVEMEVRPQSQPEWYKQKSIFDRMKPIIQ